MNEARFQNVSSVHSVKSVSGFGLRAKGHVLPAVDLCITPQVIDLDQSAEMEQCLHRMRH